MLDKQNLPIQAQLRTVNFFLSDRCTMRSAYVCLNTVTWCSGGELRHAAEESNRVTIVQLLNNEDISP